MIGTLEKMPKHQERVFKKANRDHLDFMLTLMLTSVIINAYLEDNTKTNKTKNITEDNQILEVRNGKRDQEETDEEEPTACYIRIKNSRQTELRVKSAIGRIKPQKT